MPRKNPMSPIRVVMNAFFAAAAALGRSIQKPVSKEAAEIFILGHVADAEDKNAKTDERDHDQHRGREWIENKADPQGLLPERKPGKILDGAETMRMQRRHKGEGRHRQGCELSN